MIGRVSSDDGGWTPPRFAVTADVAAFGVTDARLQVVLIERANPPFQGKHALPGGFVDPDEGLEEAAARELEEETGLIGAIPLVQFGAYGDPGRDPRGRVVTAAYWALVPHDARPKGASDAASAGLVWVDDVLSDPGSLAFDHHRILGDAVGSLRQAFESTLALRLLPDEFTVSELRGVHEAVLGRRLDPANFHNRIVSTVGLVEPTGRMRQEATGRPATLYRAGPGAHRGTTDQVGLSSVESDQGRTSSSR